MIRQKHCYNSWSTIHALECMHACMTICIHSNTHVIPRVDNIILSTLGNTKHWLPKKVLMLKQKQWHEAIKLGRVHTRPLNLICWQVVINWQARLRLN